ncbi:hypothetical protein AAHB53_26675 [Niallia circulans]
MNHYLKNMDWYADLKRNLEIKPDGMIKRGFTHYEYIWQKETETVVVKFEKTSRGICSLETKDFQIELTMDNHKCIEEIEHKVYLKMKNKTANPLSLEALADNQGRIQCSFQSSQEIKGNQEIAISSPFTIKKEKNL